MSDIPDILTLYPVSKVEALERTARVDASIAKQLSQSMAINATLRARIEALEATLEHIEALCFEAISYGHTDINKVLSVVANAALDKDAGK
jgi:hypothetical protein